jgi:hypothetical protein
VSAASIGGRTWSPPTAALNLRWLNCPLLLWIAPLSGHRAVTRIFRDVFIFPEGVIVCALNLAFYRRQIWIARLRARSAGLPRISEIRLLNFCAYANDGYTGVEQSGRYLAFQAGSFLSRMRSDRTAGVPSAESDRSQKAWPPLSRRVHR